MICMTEQGKYSIDYAFCFFEVPFKRIMKASTMEKGWPCPVIWMIIGMFCVVSFTLRLRCLNSSVNWLTTLYFVGGLGWVPAVLCFLSRAYYKMCQQIYPYLDESDELLVQQYKQTANLIFGYLRNSTNVFISIVIWVLMLATVIVNNTDFSEEYTTAAQFIYLFYILVGIAFTSVPCAVVHFLWALFKLKKLELKKHALYQGAGERLQTFHANCILLIWGIIILLFLLSVAMLKSPYHEVLWLWLPVFGFVPLALFIINHKLTKTLINTALYRENATLQKQINEILEKSSIERENILLYALLGIQENLRIQADSKFTLANAVLLISTILGGMGSIAAAGFAAFSSGATVQGVMLFLSTHP